jgi:hypothetical protein
MASNSTPLCCPHTLTLMPDEAKKPYSAPFLPPLCRAQPRLVLPFFNVPRLVISGPMGLGYTTKRLPHLPPQACTTKDRTVSSTSRNPITASPMVIYTHSQATNQGTNLRHHRVHLKRKRFRHLKILGLREVQPQRLLVQHQHHILQVPHRSDESEVAVRWDSRKGCVSRMAGLFLLRLWIAYRVCAQANRSRLYTTISCCLRPAVLDAQQVCPRRSSNNTETAAARVFESARPRRLTPRRLFVILLSCKRSGVIEEEGYRCPARETAAFHSNVMVVRRQVPISVDIIDGAVMGKEFVIVHGDER